MFLYQQYGNRDIFWAKIDTNMYYNGKIAMAITIIPTPPSHCRRLRHSKIPGGAESSPIITVEPVVVIPDMDSKNASETLRFNSQKAKGRAPTVATATQLMLVNIKA